MASTVYTRAFTGNKEVYTVKQRMFWQSLKENFWGPMIGETSSDGRVVDKLDDSPSAI